VTAITAPVYGFYAGNDARVTATVPATTEAMKAAGKKYDPVIYDGAGHGFMRAGQAPDASDANKKAWDEGFKRLVDLINKTNSGAMASHATRSARGGPVAVKAVAAPVLCHEETPAGKSVAAGAKSAPMDMAGMM
jgi:carboxymethylenebutenolidase